MIRLSRSLRRRRWAVAVAVAVDVEHDQWAVLQHGRDVRATPTLRRDLDQRPPLVRIDDYSRGSRNVGDHELFQVHHNMRVGGVVVCPFAVTVRTWHTAEVKRE